MQFTKMQGAGNDYVYINGFKEHIEDPSALSIKISDRHFGVGSDGLVIILPSDKADFFMDMYNADGSRGKMCGNAVRCVAKYVTDNKMTDKTVIAIETLSGIKAIETTAKNGETVAAKVNMGSPILKAKEIPTEFKGDSVLKQPLNVGGIEYSVTCVSMGNPHCIIFASDTDTLNLPLIGPKFENHEMFPDRINTEFAEPVNRSEIKMRVWERGSGETMACGTGACAVVVASILNGYCDRDSDITVHLLGGDLVVRWDSKTGDVFMTGPCQTVFTGDYYED